MARTDSSFHEIAGIEYPRVTSILSVIDKSGPLMGWAVKTEREAIREALLDLLTGPGIPSEPEQAWKALLEATAAKRAALKEKDRAADIGSAAHKLIEWHTKRELHLPVGPEPRAQLPGVEWAFMAWQDWWKKKDFDPVNAEILVHSKMYGYAGILDLEGMSEQVTVIVDYKTGRAVYPEAMLQNWAYRMARAEMLGWPIEKFRGLIVRLPKTESDPAFEVVEVPQYYPLFEAFLAAKRLWEWQREAKK